MVHPRWRNDRRWERSASSIQGRPPGPGIVRQIRTPTVPQTGTRSRFRFTIGECPPPSTYRLFTPGRWPRSDARSRPARLARNGSRPLGKVWEFNSRPARPAD
jgi:hypothetical protein